MLALGGNAMTNVDGRARPEDQIAAAEVAMAAVAELLDHDVEVVITHGNGPQVGNLLVKNELAAAVVPPVPLDWCGAQTQATLGFVLMDALDAALAAARPRDALRHVVTRTLVDPNDPGFVKPTKPIGRYLPADEAALLVEHGETWEDRGEKGWRRVVASPEPLDIIDAPAVLQLIGAGFVVVANGGGGIPVVRREDGSLLGRRGRHRQGPRRGAARGAGRGRRAGGGDRRAAGGAAVRQPDAQPIGRVGLARMLEPTPRRATSRAGRWGRRSRRSAASCRRTDQPAVITSLDQIVDAVTDVGTTGTVVVPD